MEIVYFVLGVVTILLILGTVVIVRVSTSVKELMEEVQQLEKVVGDAFSDIHDLHRRIDDEVHRRIDDDVKELNSRINFNEREFFSQLDSRLDKLESKLTDKFSK